MDDKFTERYSYKANSNLVLPTNTSLIDKRPSNEATGEVQSLTGRISGKMGDRATAKPPTKLKQDENEKRSSTKETKRVKIEPDKLKTPKNTFDIEFLRYEPKTEKTIKTYGYIIRFVRNLLGPQPDKIINYAADEVLTTMKDPSLTQDMRRAEIENLLSVDQTISDDDYNTLCNLCKTIDDWDMGQTKVEDDFEEETSEIGGVEFVDDEDELLDDRFPEVRDIGDEGSDYDGDLSPLPVQGDIVEANKSKINLEELSQRQTKIIPKIDLPDPIRKVGYQEYHVAPKQRSDHHRSRDSLIKIQNLDKVEQDAFRDFQTLNLIQSKIYKKATSSKQSLLICAPTGAGKTNIAILTMLGEIKKYQNKDGKGFDTDKFKIIYIAPLKALVQEIVENFKKRLGVEPYKLRVDELTGDHQLDQTTISKTQIIVCTPEKWDISTRKSQDRLYTKQVRLVIFDEIHLLHNERGATLEALVARIKRHRQIEGEKIRIVGLSATLPNYQDVSRFIAPEAKIEDSTFYFDNSYRPIPLKLQYVAITDTKKGFRMMDSIVYDKVIERLEKHTQILIFVHTRPSTSNTAEFLKCRALEENKIGLFLSSESSKDVINEYGTTLNSKLKELLQFGLGVHHAGLSREERSCVEELFRNKYIKVLVSTATLAWGVNLPARTVIIKGTEVYRDGVWTDLDSLDLTQMLGRAGRPGYDKEGEGIVITQQSQVNFYMSLMTEQLPVESKLIGRLAEQINAECVVNNIESLDDAVKWLSETYLSSRMASVLRQPENKQYLTMYGIDPRAIEDDPNLIAHKRNLAYAAAKLLCDRGLIIFDLESGAIKSTELGRIASHSNCTSRTIKLFNDSIHEYTSDIELLRTFSLADEFKDIFVRRGEEMSLQELIKALPFPIDDKCATPGANKVNALLQVYFLRSSIIQGSDLISDMHFIKDNADRLANAIHEIVLMKGYARVAELSLDLCRKIRRRMTVCHSPLRQFPDDLEADVVKQLEKKNYHVEELRVLKAEKLSELLRVDRKQGDKIYRLLRYLPKLKLEASVQPISETTLKIVLTVQPDFSWDENYHRSGVWFWLLVEDVNQEVLLHYDEIVVKKYKVAEKISTTFYVPYLTPVNPFYFIRIFPKEWFGCDQSLPVYVERLNLPNETAISTPWLDCEPYKPGAPPNLDAQTIKSLNNTFAGAYKERFKNANFNQIQTQAFKYMYESDQDVILLAAAGSGKTTCAELAVMRNINMKGTSSKCAYIGANWRASQLIYNDWTKLFGNLGVTFLTGKTREDAARIDNDDMNIVIGDPESWHMLALTRPKRFRKLFDKFQLFIIDHIHRLHNDKSSVLEWLCSRIRAIITERKAENPARVVVLGSPMACAYSLRDWLTPDRGSNKPVLLYYPPSIRPVNLKLTIQKYHSYNYEMRLLTMHRPAYRYITQDKEVGDKPVLIFVADYQKALDICEALFKYSQSEGRKFGCSVKPKDQNLQRYLPNGIGYIHSGMDKRNQSSIEQLFREGKFQILVVTVAMCWSVQIHSYLTIIMDTQQFNGFEASDYEFTDVMQMVGLTGRPLMDHKGECIVMCHSSKADYYERFLREPLPIESELPGNLIAHVNYEVATGSLKKLQDIYRPYLVHTFLYKRISINPNFYGEIIPDDTESRNKVLGAFFNRLANNVTEELAKNQFISVDDSQEDHNFSPRHLAQISLEYYINYETLSNYAKWLLTNSKNLDLKTLELIELISTNTVEFRKIPVRHGELQILKSLKRRHRPRDSDQVHSSSFKVKLLILSQYQKTGGREDDLEGELIEDRYYVIATSYRLLTAIGYIGWLNDSFSLVRTSIQLLKKLAFYTGAQSPNLDVETSLTKVNDDIKIDVTVTREGEPISVEEFIRSKEYPPYLFRDESWYFLVHGFPVSKKDNPEKLLLFEKVKTPLRGVNEYKLEFTLPDNACAYTYDLYLMSDFYSSREDRKVPSINVNE